MYGVANERERRAVCPAVLRRKETEHVLRE